MRNRLGVVGSVVVAKRASIRAPFLDVGPVSAVKPPPRYGVAQADTPNPSANGVQLRLELGGGVVLHIARQ